MSSNFFLVIHVYIVLMVDLLMVIWLCEAPVVSWIFSVLSDTVFIIQWSYFRLVMDRISMFLGYVASTGTAKYEHFLVPQI